LIEEVRNVPEKCDQGIFLNGSVKKRIVAVFIGDGNIV